MGAGGWFRNQAFSWSTCGGGGREEGGGDSRGTVSTGTLITLHHVAKGIGEVSVIAYVFDCLHHLEHSVTCRATYS